MLEKEDKPVVFKKDTVARNKKRHPDISDKEYNELIGEALYNNDIIIPEKSESRPNYYHFVKKLESTNSVVLLELANNKDNYEIVHVQKIRRRGVERLKEKNR